MSCFTSFIKYLLFALNILFWLAGVAILGVGIWLKVDKNVAEILNTTKVPLQEGATALIVIGCVIFVIGFCGCCGAIKENKCLLGTYFVFVLLIFIAELAIGIWAFASQSSIENSIRTELNNSVPLMPGSSKANDAIAIQQAFKCCGYVNGCSDWNLSNATGCSCDSATINNPLKCGAPSGGCINGDSNPTNPIYQEDCFTSIMDLIKLHFRTIAGVVIGIAVGELFLLIATIIVCRSAGKRGYETA